MRPAGFEPATRAFAKIAFHPCPLSTESALLPGTSHTALSGSFPLFPKYWRWHGAAHGSWTSRSAQSRHSEDYRGVRRRRRGRRVLGDASGADLGEPIAEHYRQNDWRRVQHPDWGDAQFTNVLRSVRNGHVY